MSQSQTMSEVRSQRKKAMGDELGELHYLLYLELATLHLNWKEYRTLFAESPETIEVLNATAPRFFYRLDRFLWNDVLLHLCRITDPPQSVGKSNLTIQRLPPLLTDATLRSNVEALVEKAKNSTSFARDWRNRHLSHRDLEHAKDPKTNPLAAASRADVEEALDNLRSVLNAVKVHFEDHPTHYERVVRRAGGAASLVAYLQSTVES